MNSSGVLARNLVDDLVAGNQNHLALIGAKNYAIVVGCHDSIGEQQAARRGGTRIESYRTNPATSLMAQVEDGGSGAAAEAIVEALTCNRDLGGASGPERARACKTKLAAFVAGAAPEINVAVQSQAQLEAQVRSQSNG